MKSAKILVITSIDDAHADYIINALNIRGLAENVIRLNTEHFIENCVISFSETGFKLLIKDSDRLIKSNEITSVWYRRPKDFAFQTIDPKVTQFIHKQSTAILRGIYFATHDTSKWVNPLPCLHKARIKLQQLTTAKSIGFDIPKTIATNDPKAALEFISNIPSISTKSLDEPNFQTDRYIYPLFNRLVTHEFIEENIESIKYCPTLFQEYINKDADIRVVVIGSKIFAFKIYSQENPLTVEDFRAVSPSQLRHEMIRLPSKVERNIHKYMSNQGLIYSALDFALSKDGRFYFLENNPNGQWLWLELQTGIKISTSLISELLLE